MKINTGDNLKRIKPDNSKLNDDVMYEALLNKDSDFEGVFFAGVRTTGIFCRPTCTARKPKKENVVFYHTTHQAIIDGYRACKVCRPLENPGSAPPEIDKLLKRVHEDHTHRLKDVDIREMGLEPSAVRRWFFKTHGMTFHAYQRILHINHAFTSIKQGSSVINAAFDSGYSSLSGFNDMFRNITGFTPSYSKNKGIVRFTQIGTPLGMMVAGEINDRVCLLEFADRKMLATELKFLAKHFNAAMIMAESLVLNELRSELDNYFEGRLRTFTVPIHSPGTDFQQKVWLELKAIPYGVTRSYKEQAQMVGSEKGVRAVANANGMNRIAIMIPCHRIIGEDGDLKGYGGGVWRKRWLIDFEKQNCMKE